mmetsp:Transcript_842/g.2711  ORF Transcript_842/g.2711 Transcript_842/m.2711 type:complete len:80 (+) Transcript_842:554-793(+)
MVAGVGEKVKRSVGAGVVAGLGRFHPTEKVLASPSAPKAAVGSPSISTHVSPVLLNSLLKTGWTTDTFLSTDSLNAVRY